MRGRTQLLVVACGAVLVTAVVVGIVVMKSGRSTHDATLPKASCGSAETFHVNGDTRITTAQPNALTCFETAVRRCVEAGIQVVERGVDTGTRYVFRIEPGSTPCQVVEVSQAYSATGGYSQIRSLICRDVTVGSRGVTLTCDGQKVLIPATVSAEP